MSDLKQMLIRGELGVIPWAIEFLGHHLPVSSPDFHYEMIQLARTNKLCAFAAPRSHAKTTIMSLIYVLFEAAVNKCPFILIVGDTATMAEQRTSDINAELTENEYLIQTYPHLRLPQGNDYKKQQVKRTTKDFITMGGIRFSSKGAGQSLRGLKHRQHRPKLILVDDLENDEAVATAEQRAKLENWFLKSLMNLPGSDGGKIIVVGTLIHRDSLMSKLVSPDFHKSWRKRLWRSETNGVPLWPEAWPMWKLAEKRDDIGAKAYATEYLNDPVDESRVLFKQSWIDDAREYGDLPTFMVKAVAVDPSASSTGDECGIVVGGLALREGYKMDPETRQYRKVNVAHGYLLDDVSIQGSPSTWARMTLDAYHNHDCDFIVIEKNQGGEMVLSTLKAELHEGEELPPIKLVHASQGKAVRADPVAIKYENGLIHHVGKFKKAEEELTTWIPGMKSPNRLDAIVWLFSEIMGYIPEDSPLLIGWAG